MSVELPKGLRAEAPFSKGTTYKENYPDWEVQQKMQIISPPNLKTTDGRLPFFGKTSNMEYGSFGQGRGSTDFSKFNIGKQEFKDPIGFGVHLIGKS
jgi:hypothetical protein